MKVIAEPYFAALVEYIIKDKQRKENIDKYQDVVITGDALFKSIKEQLGDDWALNRERRLTAKDVDVLANATFFRESGQRMLLVVAIIILAIAAAVKWLPMNTLYFNLAYTFMGIIALTFTVAYSRRQAKVRKEFRWKFGVKELDKTKG